jgi:hypothetical protein
MPNPRCETRNGLPAPWGSESESLQGEKAHIGEVDARLRTDLDRRVMAAGQRDSVVGLREPMRERQ